MRNLIFTFSAILLLTSCVSTKKFSSFIKPKFEQSTSKRAIKNSNIIFDFSKLEMVENIVKSEKLKSQFIPAILFWQWQNNIKCHISPKSVGNKFKYYFLHYSEALGLSEKLINKNIELEIEEIPSSFVYANKGYTIIFIIAYSISQLEAIYPEKRDFIINYKIKEDGQEKTSGEIRITNKDVPLKNIWSTTSKLARNYVEQFDNNIKSSAKETVETLLENLH